jgi:hypothetical protein
MKFMDIQIDANEEFHNGNKYAGRICLFPLNELNQLSYSSISALTKPCSRRVSMIRAARL